MIVYLARAIQAFVMYCVNGTSRSSLLIESTNSMIIFGESISVCCIDCSNLQSKKIFFLFQAVNYSNSASDKCNLDPCVAANVAYLSVGVHTVQYTVCVMSTNSGFFLEIIVPKPPQKVGTVTAMHSSVSPSLTCILSSCYEDGCHPLVQ